jgi:hypothetical protein
VELLPLRDFILTRDPDHPNVLRASVIDRFGRIATKPNQERKFPVGPESAKKLGYERSEVDASPSPLPTRTAASAILSLWAILSLLR